MATFFLVPGGWTGSWAYDSTVAELVRHGHAAHSLTLPGLAPGETLAGVNLDTHIEAVMTAIETMDLHEVVLCGHSYGAQVISGTADRIPDRISALINVDGFVPEDGESLWDRCEDRVRASMLRRVRGDGIGVVPPRGSDPRCRPHPFAGYLQALKLNSGLERVRDRTFVHLSGWGPSPLADQFLRLRQDPVWNTVVVSGVHDIFVETPELMWPVLLDIADRVDAQLAQNRLL